MTPFIMLLAIIGISLGLPNSAQSQEANFAKRAKKILARFKHEPTIREVHRAAMTYALVNQGRILSLLSRARFAGWLPEFRFRYNRNIDDDRNTAFPTSTTPILTTQSTDLDHRFEFRAS